ncbi:V-type ATP synthase subunit F [Methanosphaera sp. WGK6]|uniref:V-type ATP synthase subunit F n=1 Tax=Methanosphaera sp. WGK6 TaxID=1561964 RepID=UPI00084C387A|nr:V-type ATP synthase subunit F [Methanosphaera sp. WGK6]OED30469.1 ATP synthase subunit F [Methanosphaera sp. WGK6]
MKNDIAIMADPDTVTGFMLGGIKSGFPVHNKDEAQSTLKELVDNEYSIIITTEKIGDELRDDITKYTGSKALPMIIEVPDKSGSHKRETDPMNELIKRVIGVEMVK